MRCTRGHELVMDEVARLWVHPEGTDCEVPEFASMSDEELIRLADRGAGNCTHDAHLGLNTYDCDRCNARREARKREI